MSETLNIVTEELQKSFGGQVLEVHDTIVKIMEHHGFSLNDKLTREMLCQMAIQVAKLLKRVDALTIDEINTELIYRKTFRSDLKEMVSELLKTPISTGALIIGEKFSAVDKFNEKYKIV